MRLPKKNRILSIIMAVLMVLTSVSWTEFGTMQAEAADYGPDVTYTFDQIKEMANIPVMNLVMAETDNYTTLKTDKEAKQNIAEFELTNTEGKGSDIYLTATVDEETGETVYPLTAKGRGNSSWRMATGKKPYNIKFDSKQNILGMGKAKSWCLVANWVDTTHIRNYMAYELACMLGMGTPDCELIALCINGTFEGIYLITEKVGLNSYRTEIPESSADRDKNGDGIITEIIVETDARAYENGEPGAFTTNHEVNYVPKDPDPEDLAASELEVIENELNAMEAAVMSGANYEEYIDVDSWVDTYIINELTKNPDFGFGYQNYYSSTYLYFREGGKVYAGPVWDFDIAFGRSDYSQMASEGYRDIANTTGYLTKETKYYKELFENTDFEERVIKRWKEIREEILPTWMGTTFAEGYDKVKELNALDVEIWGDQSVRKASDYDMGREPLSFEKEVSYVKNFITERVAWLDEQWNVDQVSKKFSGSWNRWDGAAGETYDSYEAFLVSTGTAERKTDVEDIWDGGYGGREKSGTEVQEKGAVQTQIPGVALAQPFTLTMERQRGQYDWSAETSHAYDIWKDGEASQGFGSVKESIQVTESGRYVGLTTSSYYIGDTTAVMGQNNVQVYVVDVGTDGSVTVHDGSVQLSYEGRVSAVTNTSYSNIEKTSNGYKVSFKSNGRGNAGTVIGGDGNKQFRIYLPEECAAGDDQTGTLTVTKRAADSNYADILAKQDVTYVQAAGERPVSWSVEGDAVLFDETSGKVTAVKEGTSVITAAAGSLTSSVTIHVTENTAEKIEYEADATLGKYYGNTEDVVLNASEAERGTWATIAPGNITRFRFTFDMTQEEADKVTEFSWLTKNGDQIIGGPGDYFVYVNEIPLFAATADTLDYTVEGFDEDNTVLITDTELPEYLYAYMNGKAGSMEGVMTSMTDFVHAGTNTVDIFVVAKDGAAVVLPYLCGTTTISDDSDPIVPEEPTTEEPTTEEPTTEEPTTEEPTTEEPTTEEPTTEEPATEEPTTEEPTTEEPEIPEVEYEIGFVLSGESVTMTDLSSITIGIVFTPSNIPNSNVIWISSDETVATVDDNGIITAHKPGTVEITATSEYNGKTATVVMEVVPAKFNIEIESADQIRAKENTVLEAVFDKDVYEKAVTWTIVSGENYATLENNVLTGVKAGSVLVKAESVYNAECYVTKEITITNPRAESMEIQGGNLVLEETKSTELVVKVMPEDADMPSLTWTSSNNKVATVDAFGNLTAVGTGTAVITVTNKENSMMKDTILITVEKMNYEFELVLTEDELTMTDLSSMTIGTQFTPSNVPDKTVTWKTSNSSVATVSSNGIITAHKPGQVQITATSTYDNKTATVAIEVLPVNLTVAIDSVNEMTEGESVELKASVNKNVADTSVTWSVVSGKGYGTLTGNVLKGTKAGTIVVKAVSNYNNTCYATKEITINAAKAEEESGAVMTPGTPLAKPIVITMEKQMGQYEWSSNTTHAYDIWADGKASQGFGQVKMELTITTAGRYVGLTSASYYVGDRTVQMGKDDTQVYIIDVANDGSITVYDGKVKINYFERTATVVDTTYANVTVTSNGYKLSYKSNGRGNAGQSISR